jgi:hypothetical protein
VQTKKKKTVATNVQPHKILVTTHMQLEFF